MMCIHRSQLKLMKILSANTTFSWFSNLTDTMETVLTFLYNKTTIYD